MGKDQSRFGIYIEFAQVRLTKGKIDTYQLQINYQITVDGVVTRGSRRVASTERVNKHLGRRIASSKARTPCPVIDEEDLAVKIMDMQEIEEENQLTFPGMEEY